MPSVIRRIQIKPEPGVEDLAVPAGAVILGFDIDPAAGPHIAVLSDTDQTEAEQRSIYVIPGDFPVDVTGLASMRYLGNIKLPVQVQSEEEPGKFVHAFVTIHAFEGSGLLRMPVGSGARR